MVSTLPTMDMIQNTRFTTYSVPNPELYMNNLNLSRTHTHKTEVGTATQLAQEHIIKCDEYATLYFDLVSFS